MLEAGIGILVWPVSSLLLTLENNVIHNTSADMSDSKEGMLQQPKQHQVN